MKVDIILINITKKPIKNPIVPKYIYIHFFCNLLVFIGVM